MKKAYDWSLAKDRLLIWIDDEYHPVRLFTVASSSQLILNEKLCRDFLSNELNPHFDCFYILIQYFREIGCLTVNNHDWKLSTCTCSFYQKKTTIATTSLHYMLGTRFQDVILIQSSWTWSWGVKPIEGESLKESRLLRDNMLMLNQLKLPQRTRILLTLRS